MTSRFLRSPLRRTVRAAGLGLSAALLLAAPEPAAAQVRVEITVPTVRFEVRPPLVVVSPGIEVVQDYEHEVFVVGGLWWTRHDGHWYRARRHDGRWVRVERSTVPVRLRELPRGKYRHWKAHEKAAKAREHRVKQRRHEAKRKGDHGRREHGKHGHDGHRGQGRGGHGKHKKGKGK